VLYRLPGGIEFRLLPEGEIAEFLAFPWLFEKTEVALVAGFLKPGMSVIDVGANVGLYSILASQRVGDAGAVWAFEPSRESILRLEKNLGLNGCQGVHVVPLALSDTADPALRLTSDPGFGDAYRYLAPTPGMPGSSRNGDARAELVSVTTLDRWAAEIAIGPVDFLKVDIEGGEYRMFLGAREFLAANPGIVVMFECERDWCARAGCRPEDTFDLLGSLGFGVYAWDRRNTRWGTDPRALGRSGMLWATRDERALPAPAGLGSPIASAQAPDARLGEG
jgi:FkbM family methyltransferase